MPTGGDYHLKDDGLIAELFFSERHKLVRYARIQLEKYDSDYIDTAGRAEDIVQELFYTACSKESVIRQRACPESWLYGGIYYKVREALREDRKWVRSLMLLPSEEPEIPFPELEELPDFIPKEDYDLLRRLYVEGYTYKELCEELGVNKSNLGMKINRIKKRFKEKHEKFFK